MAINNKDYKPYGPFKLWTIENFPFIEADFDAITNYQLYSKIVEYMKNLCYNQTELQKSQTEVVNYVNNYFKDLDVQEEINNKLDEMAESGQLTEIIAQYLQLAGVLSYNTISDMSNADNIVDGSICYTLGQNSYNDGKGGFYKIRTITSGDVVDGYNIVSLNISETLIAERINTKVENEVVILNNEIKNKINKYIPKFISENENYYIRIGTKEHDKHYLQFSTDLINWHTICDLPYEIFMQPTSYPNSYDMSCFIYNNEFYIIYDYVDENYNDWSELDNTKFLFGNRLGITKTSDFVTWEKYAVSTPLEYKQIANPRIYFEDDNIYLSLVANDGTLTQDETAYYHFPIMCKLDLELKTTSNYQRLINSADNLIDPFIYKENSYYYLFVSTESPRSIKVYKNSTLDSQFTTLVDTIDYYWNIASPVTIEGASLIKKDNLYYLIMDSIDHKNLINITSNIESWNNCFFANTDNIMGNAQICEIKTTSEKTLMKEFYKINDYPMYNKYVMLENTTYNYFNQTKKTFELFAIPNKRFTAYSGTWNITVNKSLMKGDNDTCVIVNESGSSNNLKLINIYGNDTYCYLPVLENISITRNITTSTGSNRYIRLGHEAVNSITANTKKTITLTIPGVTYSKVKSVQVTPFTSGSNTKQVFCYVDTVTTDSIIISILSNEDISAMEIYWVVYLQ